MDTYSNKQKGYKMKKYLFRVVKYELYEVDADNIDEAMDILLEDSGEPIDNFYHCDSFNDTTYTEVKNNDIEKAKAELKEGLEEY
tara:strand:- start:1790 stop:2044 length:255 start_codon:yes stop_codon:yes gene_type:complete